MAKCRICKKEFEKRHFNQKYCDQCKLKSVRLVKKRYKQSEKGKLSNKRWVGSEKRKQNEIGYRQKPRAKKFAVLRAKRYLEKHPYAIIKKREIDKRYSQTENGKKATIKAARKYRKTEKGKQARKNAKAIRRQANKQSKVTSEEWQNKLKEFNYRCAYCRKKVKLEQDHIIPLSKGGEHNIKNIQPLCRSCNARKSNRLEEKNVLLTL